MILYEAVSTYHILRAIVAAKAEKKEAALLFYQKRYDSFADGLKDYINKTFSKVILYDISFAHTHGDAAVKKYFRTLLSECNKIDKIYCGCPHYSFGYYLAISNTPFVFCEDAAGILTRPEMIIDLNKNHKDRQSLHQKYLDYGLYDATNRNITNYFCNLKAQADFKNLDYQKAIDFDVVKELASLPEYERNEIISAFIGNLRFQCEKDSLLLLTQYFTGHGILSFENQVLIYQLVVDYFFPAQKVIFKPHPDDVLYYKKLFPSSDVIRTMFPSEFIPFIFNPKPKNVATISSTGIFNLRGHFDNCFELDTDFQKRFPFIHRYYTALRLFDSLKMDTQKIGCNDALFGRLEEKYCPNSLQDLKNGTSYVIDDISSGGEDGRERIQKILSDMAGKDCAIFINSASDYCWYDYFHKDLWENIIPIVIHKSIINESKEDSYASLEEEVIYVYSKSKEILSMARQIQAEKTLENSNIKIQTAKLTPEQERIKILEGMLAATEKRLLHYIEKENAQSDSE